MPEGFTLNLQPYCAYCGEFKPETTKIDASSLDSPMQYFTTIFCRNQNKCANLVEHMKTTVKEDDSTGTN